jgi:hypothetical protein
VEYCAARARFPAHVPAERTCVLATCEMWRARARWEGLEEEAKCDTREARVTPAETVVEWLAVVPSTVVPSTVMWERAGTAWVDTRWGVLSGRLYGAVPL